MENQDYTRGTTVENPAGQAYFLSDLGLVISKFTFFASSFMRYVLK